MAARKRGGQPGAATALDVQERVVRELDNRVPLREVVENLVLPTQPFSEKSLWRWKKDWDRLREAYQQIESGHISTLEELNAAFSTWLDGYYHIRVHGGTGQTPKARLSASQREPRRLCAAELTDIFLWEEERKVDKTGCVKVAGNLYEVDLELVGAKVLLRYDPFDLSVIQVWHNKKRYDNAGPVNLTRPYHRKVKPEEPQKQLSDSEEFSFFRAVEQRRLDELSLDPLTFVRGGGKDRDDTL